MKSYHARKLAPFAVMGLILVGLLIGAGCHTAAPGGVRPNVWNERLILNLEAQGETSGPFLSPDPSAGSATQFKIASDPAAGASSLVAGVQGNPAVQGTAFSSTPLAQPYYLNLSIPVYGVIYVTNTASSAASKGIDSTQLRVVVKNGATLVGGDTITYNAAVASTFGKWMRFPFHFRSEVAALNPGAPVTVEVIRMNGLSDLAVGTEGTGSQSFIEFRYFSSNPLSGTIYLERGRFSSSGGEELTDAEFQSRLQEFQSTGGWEGAPPGYVSLPEASSGGGPGVLAFIAFGSLLAVGLVMPRRRPPLKPVMAALLVLTLVFAGCFGGSGPASGGATHDPDQPTPTVNQTIEPKPELDQFGIGEVEGFVHDEVGIAVRGAHVAFLGTNLFGKTDARGTFRFGNVSEGSYVMRIDADKFAPLEQEVTIVGGSLTRLNITLVYPVDKTSNDKAHVHDNWLGQTVATFAEDSFTPTSSLYTVSQNLGSTWYCDTFDNTERTRGQHRVGCEHKIPLKMSDRLVFPGTNRVEVALKWTAGGSVPKEMGLRVVTNANKSADQVFLPRASGTPFNIAIFPNEADPGHQKFSSWEFYVVLPMADGLHPGQPLYYSGGPIQFAIKLHRGVVPFEAPHRDFWGDLTEIPLTFKTNPVTAQSRGCYPRYGTGTTDGWALAAGFLVPPGTKEIRGTLKWANANFDAVSAFPQTQWGMAYLSAEAPLSEAAFKKVPTQANGTNNRVFTIVPQPHQVDQFYQFNSNSFFSADDGGATAAGGSCINSTTEGTKWTLYASAIKDPNYKDSS